MPNQIFLVFPRIKKLKELSYMMEDIWTVVEEHKHEAIYRRNADILAEGPLETDFLTLLLQRMTAAELAAVHERINGWPIPALRTGDPTEFMIVCEENGTNVRVEKYVPGVYVH